MDKKSPRVETPALQASRPLVHTKFPSLSTRGVENPHAMAAINFGFIACSTGWCCFRLSADPSTHTGARCHACALSGESPWHPERTGG
ncbi:hypothetical protein G6F54_014398 [Rhizopus delemar]|nr:hypothetical protein G6F54_014398 [Rhizopus delemar]